LRSGYLTEAANRGVPLQEAMEQAPHRSVQQASSDYNNATRRSGRAARLISRNGKVVMQAHQWLFDANLISVPILFKPNIGVKSGRSRLWGS
jgi:hypothetical protein